MTTVSDLFTTLKVQETGESYAERLFVRGRYLSLMIFEIADDILAICKFVQENQLEIDFLDVYTEAAKLLGLESPRTVQNYVAVARFYSKDTREIYSELRYSHFKFAMGYDFWLDILKEASAYLDQYGKLPTNHYLEALFANRIEEKQQDDMDEISKHFDLEADVEIASMADDDFTAFSDDTSPDEESEIQVAVNPAPYFVTIINSLKHMIHVAVLPDKKRQRAEELVSEIELVLTEDDF